LDSVGRGCVTIICYLYKWVGIHSEGVVGIDADDDVTGCDPIVKKVIGIVNQSNSRADLNFDPRTTCGCRVQDYYRNERYREWQAKLSTKFRRREFNNSHSIEG